MSTPKSRRSPVTAEQNSPYYLENTVLSGDIFLNPNVGVLGRRRGNGLFAADRDFQIVLPDVLSVRYNAVEDFFFFG